MEEKNNGTKVGSHRSVRESRLHSGILSPATKQKWKPHPTESCKADARDLLIDLFKICDGKDLGTGHHE